MKRSTICRFAFIGTLLLTACNGKNDGSSQKAEQTDSISANVNLSACNVAVGNVTFDFARYGADTLAIVKSNNAIEIHCAEGFDMFCDPNDGKLSNNTLPLLLKKIDNKKPFTLIAKVSPEFTKEGLYNAADLIVYANDTLWQKLCFEQDEYGKHRIVTVRTSGTSDDNNHDVISEPSIYMKISSDTHTIASYYSVDKKQWHMVRLYKNYYPEILYVGIASQCPIKGRCASMFEEVSLGSDNVTDFRMGE